jgi:hypothetical protein
MVTFILFDLDSLFGSSSPKSSMAAVWIRSLFLFPGPPWLLSCSCGRRSHWWLWASLLAVLAELLRWRTGGHGVLDWCCAAQLAQLCHAVHTLRWRRHSVDISIEPTTNPESVRREGVCA